jgi:hypothetical protein
MRFVAGVRWAVRAKDAGSAHMQCHMGATEDAGSRRTARPGGTSSLCWSLLVPSRERMMLVRDDPSTALPAQPDRQP